MKKFYYITKSNEYSETDFAGPFNSKEEAMNWFDQEDTNFSCPVWHKAQGLECCFQILEIDAETGKLDESEFLSWNHNNNFGLENEEGEE